MKINERVATLENQMTEICLQLKGLKRVLWIIAAAIAGHAGIPLVIT